MIAGIKKMLGIETADDVFLVATWIGVVALGVGVMSACAIAISGKIRDDGLKMELAASKIEFERYKLDADTKIAEANARANEASLSLAKLKAPRFLTPNGQKSLALEMVTD